MAGYDQAALAAFEARAASAEQRLAVLEAKILAGKGGEAAPKALMHWPSACVTGAEG